MSRNSLLADHFADLEQQHEAASLGMWIFLATEVMFFGGLFTAYAVYRRQYAGEFALASNQLNVIYGAVNTVILLTSSLTMAMAVHAASLARRRSTVVYLLLTALLGIAFLTLKGFEYHEDYTKYLVPGFAFHDQSWPRPEGVKMFLLLYFFMTGVHALHLLIGIVLMGVLACQAAWSSQFNATPIEVGGLYWHFVDVIWVFLLPLLYLVGGGG